MSTDHRSKAAVDEITTIMGGVPVDDLPHARHVARLAQDLFQLTWPMHGFGHAEAELLRRAALLHDAGILVTYRGHHKETLRLIAHAALPGLTQDEQLQVACIARYHRKALPKKHHAIYGDLPRQARERVRELGGILRLADAFDYEHDGAVQRLYGHVMSASGQPAHVLIRAIHHFTDHEALRRVMERAHAKRDLFECAFHCRVSIAPEYEPKSDAPHVVNGFAAVTIHQNHHQA
jgi:exopolyphosphatase/guanosine-5'-triphosphate,3'-diphosphate pyrophosphatase